MAESYVTVVVHPRYLKKVPEVAQRLRRAGMRVDSELSHLGAVIGSVEEADLSAIGKVKGVKGVTKARSVSAS